MKRFGYSPVLILLTFLLSFLRSESAFAYTWMVRHDYSGCVVCHADPSGGALLTPYGRAQGELLLRTRYGKERQAEEPSRVSEFAFGARLPEQLLLGGDFRGLYLWTQQQVAGSGQPALTDARPILMQADLQAQLQFGRFRANGSLGYSYQGSLPAALTRRPEHNLVSRTHWLGVDLGAERNMLLRAGRMNLPFGIRSIEHNLWARSYTRTDTREHQQLGLSFSYGGEKLRAEAMAIVGNFSLRPLDYHEYGAVGLVEYAFNPHTVGGLSALITYAKRDVDLATSRVRHAYAAHLRVAPKPWVAILAEVDGLISSEAPTFLSAAVNRGGMVGFVQADFEPTQGLHLIATMEAKADNMAPTPTEPQEQGIGAWGSVAWFFAPHADLRLDAIYRAQWATIGTVPPPRQDGITVLAQAHLFL